MLTTAAAYIILGIAAIGREIENPFGSDVNDLDMEGYIRSLAVELDILTSMPPPRSEDFIEIDENCPLGPTSNIPFAGVMDMSVDGFISILVLWLTVEIRGFLRDRIHTHKSQMIDQNIIPQENTEKNDVGVA